MNSLERLQTAWADEDQKFVVVVGAGVSQAATGSDLATWTGLLASGVRRCCDGDAVMNERQAARLYGQIADGDIEDFLAGASQVMRRLSKKPGAYASWLEDSVGRLRSDKQGDLLLGAINDLKKPIVTTNYDNLLEDATERETVVWDEPRKLQRAATALDRYVFHIHGHFARAESVVLGSTTTGGERHDVAAQLLFKSLAFANSLLYIGVGGAMDGPNFNALRGWMSEHLRESPFSDFRLVVGHELEDVRLFHGGDRIVPVAYGREFRDLTAFLRGLAAGATLDISQDPASYRSESVPTYPTIGVLDHAMEAEPAVRSALLAIGRLTRLLGQIYNRSREPMGMVDWDRDDKEVIVTQMVAAIAMTGEGLRLAADELHAAVADADPGVGLLFAALSNAADEQLAHTRKLREDLVDLQSLLRHARGTHASLVDELNRRKKLTGRWEIAVQLLEAAEPGLSSAANVVEGWSGAVDPHKI